MVTRSNEQSLILRWQYTLYTVLRLMALAFTVVAIPSAGLYFSRFFGPVYPPLALASLSVLGAAALWILTRFGFAIIKGRPTLRAMGLSAILATLLAGAIIVADLFIRYPRDMNIQQTIRRLTR